MSNSPVGCEECGWTLHFYGDSYYCPNDDCLSVTGAKVQANEPGMVFVGGGEVSDFMHVEATKKALQEAGYRPTIGAEKLAEDHWAYIEEMLGLSIPGIDAYLTKEEFIKISGFHYKTAFVHGYKHAKEGD